MGWEVEGQGRAAREGLEGRRARNKREGGMSCASAEGRAGS